MGQRFTRWKPLLLLVAVVAMMVLARQLDLAARLDGLREWIGGLGAFGPLVFVLLYAIGVVFAIPGVALTVAAGAIFGSVTGVILVSIGSTAGAGLSFLVGRYFARDAIRQWLGSNETFRKLDRMTEERGAMIVLLVRLVPLFPFNLVNYGFGLTRVRFATYLVWSWLGMLPATVIYVVGTDAVLQSVAGEGVPWGLVLVAAAVFGALAIVVRVARAKLRRIDGVSNEG